MNKRKYYKIQAEAFMDYASKFSNKHDLLSLYNEWVVSKNLFGIDRHKIWLKVREMRPKKKIIVKEGSEEHRRVCKVVDILHRSDLLFLEKLINKRSKKKR